MSTVFVSREPVKNPEKILKEHGWKPTEADPDMWTDGANFVETYIEEEGRFTACIYGLNDIGTMEGILDLVSEHDEAFWDIVGHPE